ncbi:MAG: cytochrome c [Nitrospirales bacterium]|nr:cytochrome c [Nitrospirales bacterium]
MKIGRIIGFAITGLCFGVLVQGEPIEFEIGQTATQEDIQGWNIDVTPNGDGLPNGQGSVDEGAKVYAAKCAGCHGPTGVEGPYNRLVGGQGSLGTDRPHKTVGSYWPYATTLFDYIFRAMPLTAPQSLSANKVYALVAWILYRNDIIDENMVLDRFTLPTIHMPNRHGFQISPHMGISLPTSP